MKGRRALLHGSLVCGLSIAASSAPAQVDRVDLLPLLDVERSQHDPRFYVSPVGGYVRFWVERAQEPAPGRGDAREYGNERRAWLARLLIGRNHSRILTSKLIVNRTNVVTQTVTLASATHDSNRRQGENWSTELGERRFLTPYFRVDQGTTASIEVALSVSTRIEADITRHVLSVVERGARLVAPTAPLVTALNAPRMTETADFIDTSISRLFGEAVAERSQNDFPADSWYAGRGRSLARVSGLFPMGRHVWGSPESRDVGSWSIHVSEPIVSIFSSTALHGSGAQPASGSPEAVCLAAPAEKEGTEPPALTGQDRQACIAFLGLTPSRVLDLPVDQNITLGDKLRGDTGISAALQRFGGAANKDEAALTAAREICVLVAQRTQELGLNAYDAAAALWAFASNGGVAAQVSGRIWDGNCTVSRLARRLHLTLDTSSAAPAAAVPPAANGAGGAGQPGEPGTSSTPTG